MGTYVHATSRKYMPQGRLLAGRSAQEMGQGLDVGRREGSGFRVQGSGFRGWEEEVSRKGAKARRRGVRGVARKGEGAMGRDWGFEI